MQQPSERFIRNIKGPFLNKLPNHQGRVGRDCVRVAGARGLLQGELAISLLPQPSDASPWGLTESNDFLVFRSNYNL